MRRVIPAVLLALAATATSAEMSGKQFGGGGGYTHPSAEAGDYLENGPRRKTPAPSAARPAPRPSPSPSPARAAARPATPAQAKALVPVPAAASQRVPMPSLWNGLVRPMAAHSGEESVTAEGAQRYDGQAEAPALSAPGASSPSSTAKAAPAATSAASPREALFVSIEVDPGEAGTLRDAVAGLGAAGFSPDARFEARQGTGRNTIVTGWLPAARLGDAVIRPGVRRVSIETSARPAPRAVEVEGAFLLGLRVPDPSRPEASIAPALAELAREAGLKGPRVLGLETAPDGRVVAVVSGRLPLSRLSKAMARADVVKLVPAPAPEPLLPIPAAPVPPTPTPGGFARFMARKGLWLVGLTVLLGLLMPAARAGVGRGIEALNPYR